MPYILMYEKGQFLCHIKDIELSNHVMMICGEMIKKEDAVTSEYTLETALFVCKYCLAWKE